MQDTQIKKLKINYKTLEDFTSFDEYGNQELSMLEDLQNNLIENDSDSPFYGIYFGNNLIARMSLYKVTMKYDQLFEPPKDYLELWKVEVLPEFRGNGYGKALIDFAKSFNLPLRTIPRIQSYEFWEKLRFQRANQYVDLELNNNSFLWLPQGVTQRKVS